MLSETPKSGTYSSRRFMVAVTYKDISSLALYQVTPGTVLIAALIQASNETAQSLRRPLALSDAGQLGRDVRLDPFVVHGGSVP